MEDLILTSRLDSLEQNLTQIVDNSAWLRECVLNPQVLHESGESRDSWPVQVWDELDSTVGSEAKDLKFKLQDIRLKLRAAALKSPAEAAQDFNDAWGSYKEIYEYSQEVFAECLEYIGGLALRDRGFDKNICEIADKLIISCATDWNDSPWKSLTILAAQERFGQTLARIIRLRFPEWTIWTLPFTAREFAHVALNADRNRKLLQFVKEKVDELAEKEPRLVEARKSEPSGSDKLKIVERRARRHAENHIRELVADAFATYTMGPAYACAAILLRLNPIDGGSDSPDHPTDAKRAEVVLETLRLMNEKASGEPPYTDIIERLEREWTSARGRATPATTSRSAASAPRLEELIDVKALIKETLSKFSSTVREAARFPDLDADTGWLKAKDWHDKMMKALNSGESPLRNVKVVRTSKLRDALNAAWRCRIFITPKDRTDINQISEAALALCREIIKANAGGGTGEEGLFSVSGHGSAGPGAVPPQAPFGK